MTDARTKTAVTLERLAEELETAARHARTAARHFHDGEVPRGCAHVLAVEGHVRNVRTGLDPVAITHAGHAIP